MKTKRDASRAKGVGPSLAFTLVELMVVLAVVGLLAMVALPAMTASRGQTHVAQCADNLKQYNMAMFMYGSDNNDRLPVNASGNWAWDLSWAPGNTLTQYVSFRKLYCPGTSARFTDPDNAALWDYAPGFIHVLGYVAAISGSAIIATNQNITLTPQRIQNGSVYMAPSSPATRVLIADATISENTTDNRAGYLAGAKYNFTTVSGGYSLAHISPHLNGRVPVGGNLAMLDGHVQWRNFSEMDQRATYGRGFWW